MSFLIQHAMMTKEKTQVQLLNPSWRHASIRYDDVTMNTVLQSRYEQAHCMVDVIWWQLSQFISV